MGFADLHIHTIYSYDATSSVSAVLKYAAHHTSLDVIAITDHDKIGGALQALDLAPTYGIEVIPGIEVTTAEGHVLALFVSQVITPGQSIEKTVLQAVELGGLCIIPHPATHGRMGVHPDVIRRALRHPEFAAGLVGVEMFNAGLAGSLRDESALFACRQMPLAQVGSSDAHINWMIGKGATSFPGHSAEEFRQALIKRQTHAMGTYQMDLNDFFTRYVPYLLMRYAGWVTWNATPSEPLRLAWTRSRKYRSAAYQPPTQSYSNA